MPPGFLLNHLWRFTLIKPAANVRVLFDSVHKRSCYHILAISKGQFSLFPSLVAGEYEFIAKLLLRDETQFVGMPPAANRYL
jgi:hypothetical protein